MTLDSSTKYNDIGGIATAYYNIGYTYMDLNNFVKSENYLFKGLSIYEKISKKDLYVINSINSALCFLYSRWNKYEKSIKYGNEAINYFSNSGDKYYLSQLYAQVSNDYLELNNLKLAKESINKSISLSNAIGNKKFINISNLVLVDIFIKENKIVNAENILLSILPDTNNNELIDLTHKSQIYKTLSIIHAKNGNLKEALRCFEIYKNYSDTLFKQKLDSKEQEIETKYQSEKKEAEILTLQNKNLSTEVALNKESKIKWVLGAILLMTLFGLMGFWKLYTKIKSQKEYIENLQKELHHRIKNNLSIINKFIEDIKSKSTKDAIELHLSDLQNKIESINEVHKQLYDTKSATNVKLREYINTLAGNVSKTFESNIEIDNNIDKDCRMDIEQSFPIGLIVNEFITNSYKHGFASISNPKITINSKIVNNQLKQIELSDNGIGYNPTNTNKKTLGVRMIERECKRNCVK